MKSGFLASPRRWQLDFEKSNTPRRASSGVKDSAKYEGREFPRAWPIVTFVDIRGKSLLRCNISLPRRMLMKQPRGFGAVVDAQLRKDVLQMKLHGMLADRKLIGNLRVRQPLRH